VQKTSYYQQNVLLVSLRREPLSKTLLRGLDLIEEVGLHGPLRVTEIAQRMSLDVSIVSRTVQALEQDGWLARADRKISVGPRCALLGLSSPADALVRQLEPLVRAIAGVTGVPTSANALIGRDVMMLASSGTPLTDQGDLISLRIPVYVMAAGRAIAAHLSAEQLDAVLPPEPFPDGAAMIASQVRSAALAAYFAELGSDEPPARSIPLTRRELEVELDSIRATGFARDRGELDPSAFCIAVPLPAAGLPASLGCFGPRDVVIGRQELIESALRAATKPGATAQDVVNAAAAVDAAATRA
jgi:IclR family transcriptional regulator, acetate operon repressor